jgi:hypothetical protein
MAELMNWIIRKPIWGSLEDPELDPLKIDFGLGLHNGRPILTTGRDAEAIDHLVEIRRSIRENEQSN